MAVWKIQGKNYAKASVSSRSLKTSTGWNGIRTQDLWIFKFCSRKNPLPPIFISKKSLRHPNLFRKKVCALLIFFRKKVFALLLMVPAGEANKFWPVPNPDEKKGRRRLFSIFFLNIQDSIFQKSHFLRLKQGDPKLTPPLGRAYLTRVG